MFGAFHWTESVLGTLRASASRVWVCRALVSWSEESDMLGHLPSNSSPLCRYMSVYTQVDWIGEVPAERENRIHNGMRQLRGEIEGWELSNLRGLRKEWEHAERVGARRRQGLRAMPAGESVRLGHSRNLSLNIIRCNKAKPGCAGHATFPLKAKKGHDHYSKSGDC